MRIIDADELMQELREIEADGGIGMDFITFEDLIKGQPTINQWIDVKYRLPEKDTDVLVCFDDGFMATVFFGEDFDLWADSGEPIAWMPLPEPYKAGTADNVDKDINVSSKIDDIVQQLEKLAEEEFQEGLREPLPDDAKPHLYANICLNKAAEIVKRSFKQSLSEVKAGAADE